ncbi:MAG: hypothetical protein JO306_08250, partial [Gemmatimonadetes bacterium]|nr:hypothetical protein [Gemmatimonadota bacterium]
MRIPPISILPHLGGLVRATNPAIRPTARLLRGIPITLLLLAMVGSVSVATAQQGDTALAGIWAAKKRFGPDVRGTLLVRRAAGRWRAEISGRAIEPTVAGRSIAFALPEGEGEFRGRFSADRARIA